MLTCFGFLVFFQCQAPKPVVIDTYCQKTKYIYWSPQDTRKTKEQADVHNRIRKDSKCPS